MLRSIFGLCSLSVPAAALHSQSVEPLDDTYQLLVEERQNAQLSDGSIGRGIKLPGWLSGSPIGKLSAEFGFSPTGSHPITKGQQSNVSGATTTPLLAINAKAPLVPNTNKGSMPAASLSAIARKGSDPAVTPKAPSALSGITATGPIPAVLPELVEATTTTPKTPTTLSAITTTTHIPAVLHELGKATTKTPTTHPAITTTKPIPAVLHELGKATTTKTPTTHSAITTTKPIPAVLHELVKATAKPTTAPSLPAATTAATVSTSKAVAASLHDAVSHVLTPASTKAVAMEKGDPERTSARIAAARKSSPLLTNASTLNALNTSTTVATDAPALAFQQVAERIRNQLDEYRRTVGVNKNGLE